MSVETPVVIDSALKITTVAMNVTAFTTTKRFVLPKSDATHGPRFESITIAKSFFAERG